MSYMSRTTVALQIVPQQSYTVTKNDLAGAVVIAPFNAIWVSITITTDADYDGTVNVDYLDVSGTYNNQVTTENGANAIARANMVSFLDGGGGSWGAASGANRPTVNASGQMTFRVRVAVQATKGKAVVTIRYLA